MKPPPFAYRCPTSLDEALAVLSDTQNAKVLAGGQSLIAMLNLRYLFPDCLIDINRIPQLAGVEVNGDSLLIGAMTRQRAMETSETLYAFAPLFREALEFVGHRQTRNRGTIGGSLCHLDPSAELPTLALLYDATIHLASAQGRRSLAMKDFMDGYMSPTIKPEEMVTAVEIRKWDGITGYAFLEHARRRGDFAIASAACLIELSDNGEIRRAAISVGGLCETPVRLSSSEEFMKGQDGGPELFEAAAKTCLDLPAMADVHAGKDFRRNVAAAMVRRALTIAFSRAQAFH